MQIFTQSLITHNYCYDNIKKKTSPPPNMQDEMQIIPQHTT